MTDDVGYKRPPKSGQFKKGTSGNPKGRPPRTPKLLTSIMAEIYNEEVAVVVKGKKKKIPKIEIVLRRLLQDAMEGKAHSIKLLLKIMESHIGQQAAEETHDEWVKRCFPFIKDING